MIRKLYRTFARLPLALRAYLLLISLAGVGGCGWWAARVYRLEAAIREIERVGGSVHRQGAGPGWVPSWARGFWSDVGLDDVTYVDLQEGQFRGERVGIPL